MPVTAAGKRIHSTGVWNAAVAGSGHFGTQAKPAPGGGYLNPPRSVARGWKLSDQPTISFFNENLLVVRRKFFDPLLAFKQISQSAQIVRTIFTRFGSPLCGLSCNVSRPSRSASRRVYWYTPARAAIKAF